MVIYPYFPFCPIYNRGSCCRYNTAIFADKDICAIKNIISHIVLNAISTIIWVWTTLSCTPGYWLSLAIKNTTTSHKWSILHPVRTVLPDKFFQSAHSPVLIEVQR